MHERSSQQTLKRSIPSTCWHHFKSSQIPFHELSRIARRSPEADTSQFSDCGVGSSLDSWSERGATCCIAMAMPSNRRESDSISSHKTFAKLVSVFPISSSKKVSSGTVNELPTCAYILLRETKRGGSQMKLRLLWMLCVDAANGSDAEYAWCIRMYLYACTVEHSHTFIHTQIPLCMHVCLHTCKHTYMDTYTYTYGYTYTYIHIYTYMNAYIRTELQSVNAYAV